jgi:integrase
MASFRKKGGGWVAEIFVKGERESKTFSTKGEASTWAAERETELRKQMATGIVAGKTVRDAFHRYEKEVSKAKRGYRWEAIRMAFLAKIEIGEDNARVKFGEIKLSDLRTTHLAQLRDVRLKGDGDMKAVKGSTINRDFNLLSNVFSTARDEWHWIAESPTTKVRRPKDPPPRDRRPTDDETERLCFALGFDEAPVTTKSGAAAVAWLFAIETAMRAGEICRLRPEHFKGPVARLPATIIKNGYKRDVPLSKRAVQLLEYLPVPEAGKPVFGLTAASLDALFRKAKERCAIDDLTFHDSRHEAITRLSKKMDVLPLARMVGHRDLKQLLVYYNATAEEIAGRLD